MCINTCTAVRTTESEVVPVHTCLPKACSFPFKVSTRSETPTRLVASHTLCQSQCEVTPQSYSAGAFTPGVDIYTRSPPLQTCQRCYSFSGQTGHSGCPSATPRGAVLALLKSSSFRNVTSVGRALPSSLTPHASLSSTFPWRRRLHVCPPHERRDFGARGAPDALWAVFQGQCWGTARPLSVPHGCL